MKRTLIIIISLILISNHTFGQDSIKTKKLEFGICIGSNVSYATHGLNYFGYITIEKGGSLFAIGPVVGPKLKITRMRGNEPHYRTGEYRINGFHVLYQINPNPEGKIFDLFFQYEFNFLYYKDRGYEYDDPLLKGAYKAHDIYIENNVNYGFRLKIMKNINLNQSIGIGYLYYRSWINELNIDGYSGLGINAKLAINYKFLRN